MKTILAILLLFALPSPASAGEESQTYLVRIAFKNTLEHPIHVFLYPKYVLRAAGGIVAIADPILYMAHTALGTNRPNPFRERPISNLPAIPRPTLSVGPENSGILTFKEFGTRDKEIHFCFQVVSDPPFGDLPWECHLAHFTLGDLPVPGRRALLFTVRGHMTTFPEYRGSGFSVVRVEGLGSTRPQVQNFTEGSHPISWDGSHLISS